MKTLSKMIWTLELYFLYNIKMAVKIMIKIITTTFSTTFRAKHKTYTTHIGKRSGPPMACATKYDPDNATYGHQN
jgi:hypothetical protein